jgi:hypothetical protein
LDYLEQVLRRGFRARDLQFRHGTSLEELAAGTYARSHRKLLNFTILPHTLIVPERVVLLGFAKARELLLRYEPFQQYVFAERAGAPGGGSILRWR